MSNGRQMKQAIAEATDHVSEHGWRDVDPNVVTLAGFGYLADIVSSRTLYVRLDGKKFFGVGVVIGSAFVGGLLKLIGG